MLLTNGSFAMFGQIALAGNRLTTIGTSHGGTQVLLVILAEVVGV